MLTYSLTLLRRRLWVVVLGMALCLVAGAQVLVFVPPVQQSEASVLFVPSAKEPGVAEPTNPLLSLGGAVAIVASVVQVAVTDDQTQLKLVGESGASTYTVVPDLGENAGPVLMVTTQSKDAAESQRLRDEVVSEVQRDLASLQASQKVSSDLQISTVVLTRSLEPTVIRKAQIQLGVAVAAVTMLLCLGLILLAEHRSVRRRSRRAGPASPDAEDDLDDRTRELAGTRSGDGADESAGSLAPTVRTRRQARSARPAPTSPSTDEPGPEDGAEQREPSRAELNVLR
ncbi:hypothetical protein [Lapillicoccus jejuensis]|uniref:Capsular polysaccharide biosynthesis protein n=1 Tax=Lapillicoccus jejuensis TaxID=402171 RepID=A0A542E1F3_9MICO|nr:hypothetical protein [Lapillicoccus jejuensis]TQJ09168.1 hypothetical protein FB458_2276 [Lapillicoccus jejuensis]